VSRRRTPAARAPRRRRTGLLGSDGLLAVAAGDLDVARLGGFADRDGQSEDAGRVVGGDLVGIQGLAEEDLPGEGAVRPFSDEQLRPGGLDRGALGCRRKPGGCRPSSPGCGNNSPVASCQPTADRASRPVRQARSCKGCVPPTVNTTG